MTALPAGRIFRHVVPVDDAWHEVKLSGEILHIATRNPDVVEFWYFHTDGPERTRTFRIYGTGHHVPEGLAYVGTAIVPGGILVWHLMEWTQ